jgi:serine/threonine-protein kinase
MATFARPPEQKFPELKGMKIEDARRVADQANVRLLVHEGYNDNVSPGLIYQVDQQAAGRSIRPGRSINVWVSKGSKLVYVPDLTNLTKDEAEQKIKDAGLTLGTVNREYNPKVPFDSIIAQNPRARKRVERDLAVSLSISDGPKPDESTPTAATPETGTSAGNPFNTPPSSTDGGSNASPTEADRADEVNPVNLSKHIPRDGQGSRRVRIEYDDARGTHTPIDERHDEGETVTLRVDSYGPKITVRVYYGDSDKPVSEKTMTFTKH